MSLSMAALNSSPPVCLRKPCARAHGAVQPGGAKTPWAPAAAGGATPLRAFASSGTSAGGRRLRAAPKGADGRLWCKPRGEGARVASRVARRHRAAASSENVEDTERVGGGTALAELGGLGARGLLGLRRADLDLDGEEFRKLETAGFQDKGDIFKGKVDIGRQTDAIVEGVPTTQVMEREKPDGGGTDLMQELLAIQQNGPKTIGFFGTRNMGFLHQQLVEILSYAMVLTENHIYTSGATGTNAAVIRGALRAEKSLDRQPKESRELLKDVARVIECPENDHMALIDASRLCNERILKEVVQVICFAFHDSNLLLETCREAKHLRKMVTLFYLD